MLMLPALNIQLQRAVSNGSKWLENLIRLVSMHIQQNILNMFEKADHCAEDVKKYQDNAMRFDYIIHTKEDIFLFQKMSLRNLLTKYKDCDWIGKIVLAWGGLSMRFAIMKPEKVLNSSVPKSNISKLWLKTKVCL